MGERYDVVIAGLGAMGSATAMALARRGHRVLGLDRHRPPHPQGSSHGESRIIREAYFEHPRYVPFIQQAYIDWRKLEESSGRELLGLCGGLMVGPREGMLVDGALESARIHDLPCEELSWKEVRERFPQFRPSEEMVGVLEPRAGVLRVEACVEAMLGEARRAGADLRLQEPVESWWATPGGIRVRTAAGTYTGRVLVLAAGAWMPDLLGPELGRLVVPMRTVQHWFRPRSRPQLFRPGHSPIYVFEYAPERLWYGFPDLGRGIKVALHYQGETTAAEELRREVEPEEVEGVRDLMRRFMPDGAGEHLRSQVCMYTNTSDLHFLIDRHPEHPEVWIMSPCSGHGFKFAPTLGRVLADAIDGRERESPLDLAPFGFDRLLG